MHGIIENERLAEELILFASRFRFSRTPSGSHWYGKNAGIRKILSVLKTGKDVLR